MRTSIRAVRGSLAGLIGLVLAASVVGCVAPPAGQASLDHARAAVERARSAPRVRALAAAELDRAEVILQRAQVAAEAGAPASHVDHLAYAASRQAALAEAQAADRVAQGEIEALQEAFDRLLAETPERLREDRAAGEAQPAASIDAALQDLTVRLSELSFEDAELGGEAASRLDEIAGLLIDQPARRVSIEADFDLPDPVARTVMERRIESVRAAFLRGGIEASRISVRAGAPPERRAVWSVEHLAP